MRTPISLTLRTIGEGLKKDGEDIVQTPMPWTFLHLLCQLDQKEEAAGSKADETTPESRGDDDDNQSGKRGKTRGDLVSYLRSRHLIKPSDWHSQHLGYFEQLGRTDPQMTVLYCGDARFFAVQALG